MKIYNDCRGCDFIDYYTGDTHICNLECQKLKNVKLKGIDKEEKKIEYEIMRLFTAIGGRDLL